MTEFPGSHAHYGDVSTLGGFIYLASPYTNYNGGGVVGREMAFRAAAQLAGELEHGGLKVYSPVVALHPVGDSIGFDALDHGDWMQACQVFIERASALVVVMMEGWGASQGVGLEIKHFEAAGKPIFFLHIETRQLLRRAVSSEGARP